MIALGPLHLGHSLLGPATIVLPLVLQLIVSVLLAT